MLRFKPKNSVDISLPSTFDRYPHTNNGFTSGLNGTLGLPELHSKNSLEFVEAAIFKINKNGTEEIVAVLNKGMDKFVKL